MADKVETYGIALKLREIDEKAQCLRGTALFSNALAQAGEELVITFRGPEGREAQRWKRALENLNKGMAKPLALPGARLPEIMVENALLADTSLDGGVKTVSGTWARTAVSAMKALDASTRHDQRSLETGWVTQPVLCFRNPDPAENEPSFIRWPVTVTAPGACVFQTTRKGDRRPFDVAWLAKRLDQARAVADPAEPASHVMITTNLYAVNHKAAQRLLSKDEADRAVATLHQNGQSALVVPSVGGEISTKEAQFLYASQKGEGARLLPEGDAIQYRVIPIVSLVFGADSAKTLIEGMFSQDKGKQARLNGLRWLFPSVTKTTAKPVAHVMLSLERYTDKETGKARFTIWSSDLPKFEPGTRSAASLAALCAEREDARARETAKIPLSPPETAAAPTAQTMTAPG